jgi:hypothetical protein
LPQFIDYLYFLQTFGNVFASVDFAGCAADEETSKVSQAFEKNYFLKY